MTQRLTTLPPGSVIENTPQQLKELPVGSIIFPLETGVSTRPVPARESGFLEMLGGPDTGPSPEVAGFQEMLGGQEQTGQREAIPGIEVPRPTGGDRPGVIGQANIRGLAQRQQEQLAAAAKAVQLNRDRAFDEIENKLAEEGALFDPTEALNRNFSELTLRADFGRSDKEREMFFKLKELYKFGDLRTIKLSTGEELMIFREDDDFPWKPVDPKGFDELSAIADSLPLIANEQTALEVVGAFLTGGASVGRRMFGTMIAAFLGEFAQSEIERARGFEESEGIEVALNATVAALFGGTAEKLFNFRKLKKPGEFDVNELQAFLRDEGIPEVMIGQIAKSPIVRAMFQQSRASTSKGDELIRQQKIGLLDSLERRGGEIDKFGRRELEAGQEAVELAAAEKTINKFISGETKLDLPQSVDFLVRKWNSSKKREIGRNYDAALALKNDIGFDLRGTAQEPGPKDLAEQFLIGVQGLADDTRALAPEDSGLVPIDPVVGTFRRALQSVTELADVQEPGVRLGQAAPMEVIKRLRTQFWVLSQPDVPGAGRNQFQNQAFQMYRSLTRSMDNPIVPRGGDEATTKQFAKLWDRARKENRKYESTLRNAYFRQLIGAAEVEGDDFAVKASEALISASSPEGLNTLLNLASPKSLQNVKQAWISAQMRKGASIRANLDAFNATPRGQRNIRRIISAPEEKALREYGREMEKLSSAGVQRALRNQQSNIEAYRTIFNDESRERLQDLVKAAPQTKDLLRAGFYSDLIAGGIKSDEFGNRILDMNLVARRVQGAIQDGKVFVFMDTKELRNLDRFGIAAAIFSGTNDVGGALRKGSIVGNLREVGTASFIGAAHALATDKVTLSILASPAGKRLMLSNFQDLAPGSAQAIRIAGITLASAIANALKTETTSDLGTE